MCVHIEPCNHQICVSKETNGKDWEETETRRICKGWQGGRAKSGKESTQGTEVLMDLAVSLVAWKRTKSVDCWGQKAAYSRSSKEGSMGTLPACQPSCVAVYWVAAHSLVGSSKKCTREILQPLPPLPSAMSYWRTKRSVLQFMRVRSVWTETA